MINRRGFLKTTGLATALAVGASPKKLKAAPQNILSEDRMGVLVDTTVCIGCRKCEWACKVAHDLPTQPIDEYENTDVFSEFRRPVPEALTVVNRFQNEEKEKPLFVKSQCRHCDHPACVSACIVGAFTKAEDGTVSWDGDKCIGCRYCMVACPFQVPTFEYEKAFHPEIRKCDFCVERTTEGNLPACVEICPVEAMTYGKRYDVVQLGHKRIEDNPDRYIDYIYGEHEVGGTSWVYLSSMGFDKVKFPQLNSDPAPGVSETIQHGIFAYFVPPALLYALLGGIMWVSKNKAKSEEE